MWKPKTFSSFAVFIFGIIQLQSVASDVSSSTILWNDTIQDTLKKHLLTGYDKFTRPSHHENTTEVNIGFTLRHFEVDEMRSLFTVYGWIQLTWNDDKLKWNPSDYGGISVMRVADHEVWQPDVVLYNNADGSSVDHYGNTNVIIYADGSVIWVPPTKYVAFCDLDLSLWPYDTQMCSIKLGSWTYDRNNINLNTKSNMTMENLVEVNSEWQLLKVINKRNVKLYPCCTEEYVDIEYNLTISRRSQSYNHVVITPASVVILLTLANFWLPPHCGEKIILNTCTAIITCILLMYFAQKLPAMAIHTPLVVTFFSTSLYLICFSTILSIIVINLSRNKHTRQLPWCIADLLTGSFGKVLFLSDPKAPQITPSVRAEELRSSMPFDNEHDNSNADDHQMIEPAHRICIQQEYILLATALDRIGFLIYCIIFAILAGSTAV